MNLKRMLLCLSLVACIFTGCGKTAPQEISVEVPTTEDTDITIATIFAETSAIAAEAANPWHEVTCEEFLAIFGSNMPSTKAGVENDVVYRICDGDLPLGEIDFSYLDGTRHAVFRVMRVDNQDISGVSYDDWYDDHTDLQIHWRKRQDENGMMNLTTWAYPQYGYSYSLFVEGPELDENDDAVAFTLALYVCNSGTPGPGTWN